MKSTLFTLVFLIGQSIAFDVQAAGKITYLNVVDDTVYFTTDKVKASTPSCVVTENAEQWTVSLNNKTGRALYSLLVTAMAGKQAINIETGADCGDIAGIERAKGISLQPSSETSSAGQVQWAGYTSAVRGHFVYQDGVRKSPVLAATGLCQQLWPKSRVMLWNDYLSILSTYPHTNEIWFLDALEAASEANTNEYNGKLSSGALLAFKNGQTKTLNYYGNDTSNLNQNVSYNTQYSCSDWTSSTSGSKGMVMTVNGEFTNLYCNNYRKLACVY
ncbi:hypothetical protein [Thalassomonas sp. RHCl1]|uniref:hypothetical protein n=1 Tax=Thalassomonas sp. RHCl1 TaxID=2995320 RepID=UPI00248B2E6B|nr:hypothetical protein [Thalassomonas sp. RHCl1]